ncbi:hypothetical protein PHAVU_001G232100 [Phaseolus vulgaris]|uniref:Plastid movement impaired 2 n=1 Tax=Phaseolus vulgaris TaxID=3885 RepID=V7CZ49_PHAVU|nr:hypothetical protein PHAVU_001G232100g [Phaseolus vulgaris]ESW35399.1 hypothetical protein PHAVU_001G232100g [Phaseolus vulgaris]
MGNAMGSKKAKVMKIDGETFKLKTPATANDVVKDYPGHVLLDSHAVKNFGPRAKPLEPHHELRPRKLYFLVELPKVRPEPLTRRVRSSGIRGMNAKDRLDFLMLSKRSVSDLAVVKNRPGPDSSGPTRVRMRVPKAQLERLMEESHDGGEVAEKILSLYMGNNAAAVDGGATVVEAEKELRNRKSQRKRVSFSPVEQGETHEESAATQNSLVYTSPSR